VSVPVVAGPARRGTVGPARPAPRARAGAGIEEVIFGDVGTLGGTVVLNLNLFDSQTTQAVNRVAVKADGVDALPAALPGPLRELTAPLTGATVVPAPAVTTAVRPIRRRQGSPLMRTILLTALLCLGGCGIANGVAPLLTGETDTPPGDGDTSCDNPICDCEGAGCSCTGDTCTCDGPDCNIDTSQGGPACEGPCECDLSSCACTDDGCAAFGAGQTCDNSPDCECGNGGCSN
jgi:hypothetical protein